MEDLTSKKDEDKNSKLLELPDYLIINFIFPFLSNKEAFINLRIVHSYLNKIIKESLGDD